MIKTKYPKVRSMEVSNQYFITAEKMLAEGFRRDSKARYCRALQCFTKAKYFSPIKQAVHYAKIAECFYYLEQDAIARSYVKDALIIDPDCFEAYDVLYSLEWEDDSQGIFAYREMVRIKPDYVFGYHMLGKFLEEQGKIHDALSMYYQAVQKSLLNAGDQYTLRCCISRIVIHEVPIKSRYFIEDILLNPKLTTRTKNLMMHYLAYLYLENNDIDAALQQYNSILESTTKSSKSVGMIVEYYYAILRIALVFEKYYQNYNNAIKYYELVVEPKNAHCILPAYLGLRRCLIALNRIENLVEIESEMTRRCGKDIVTKFDYSVDHAFVMSYLR